MDGILGTIRGLPIPLRYAVTGAVVLGLLGGAVGLLIGLRTYAPTAWAATFEVGLPASVVGAACGAVAGSLVHVARARPERDGRDHAGSDS